MFSPENENIKITVSHERNLLSQTHSARVAITTYFILLLLGMEFVIPLAAASSLSEKVIKIR